MATESPPTFDRAGEAVLTPRAYQCACGRRVFFRNSQCLACKSPLGYVASRHGLYSLKAGARAGTWQIAGRSAAPDGVLYRRCANFATAAACNWLLEPEDGDESSFCKACRLNRTIPDLSHARNRPLWLNMERAKRRLVSQLIGLDLPVASKVSEDRDTGLAYDFLCSNAGQPRVMTGHSNGIITINLDEADDAARERIRIEMGEPYRTLLGHFRHEVGHYYWDRLIKGTPWQLASRGVFGDERQDYGAALRANYQNGASDDWRRRYVSAYASAHPFEDWAETWAHYLHLRDTLDTAGSYGIGDLQDNDESPTFDVGDLWRADAPNGGSFLEMLHRWIRITSVMNEMSRAMGQHDFYPFVLPRAAVAKLHFIHCAVSRSPDSTLAWEGQA